MKLTIKSKIIILILALVIIPISTLGTLSYEKSKKTLEKQFKNSMIQLNNDIKESMGNYFDGYQYGIEMVSKNVNAEQILIHPEYEFFLKETFKNYLDTYPDATHIYMGCIDGSFRIYPNKDMGKNYDPRLRLWYKKAVEKQSAIFTDVYKDVVTNKLAISCAAPVYEHGDKNKLIGVVGVTIPIEVLSKKINSIKVGEKGYPYILDSNGNFITHKNIELIGQEINVPKIKEILKNSSQEGIIDYEWKEEDGSLSQKVSAYKKVPELNWAVLSAVYMDEIEKDTRGIFIGNILVGIIILIVASGIGIIIANKITKNIHIIVDIMNKVKDGDFTKKLKIKSNDEIEIVADNFNVMVENVKKLLLDAKHVNEEVAKSSKNLADTSESVRVSSEEVAKSIEEIARGASEQALDVENGVKIASSLDDKFNKLANNTNTMAENSNEVIKINMDSIGLINDLKEKTDLNNHSINKTEYAIRQLSEKSSYIENILETIKSLADQTSLLSLNASVEAARAGEAGRGFAVVANEIRKLAEGSSRATNEIKEILESIQIENKNTVDIMTEVKNVSLDQTKSVQDVNCAFEKISKSINAITKEIDDVNRFVNDVIKDKDLIVEAIENISAVSEETAASSEEVTSAVNEQATAIDDIAINAQKLNKLSLELNKQLDKFKI